MSMCYTYWNVPSRARKSRCNIFNIWVSRLLYVDTASGLSGRLYLHQKDQQLDNIGENYILIDSYI